MKNVFALICTLCLMLSVALPGHAGGGRPSFSSKPSYSGGFRSGSPSGYRSFSPSPSRTYTYKPSQPTSTYSPRPAAVPRSYSYSPPKATIATPVLRSTTKRTVINNHYHGESGHSSGGGLSMMDYVMLHSLSNHNNGPTYINAQPSVVTAVPTAAGAPTPILASNGTYDAPAVIYQEESHFWRNTILFIVVLLVIGAIVLAGVHHYTNLDLDED